MPVAVAGQFMPLLLHLSNEKWKTAGHPSQKEKCPLCVVSPEEIQNFASIRNYPRGPILPGASRDFAGESLHLEVIFDINTQYMSYASAAICSACCRRMV